MGFPRAALKGRGRTACSLRAGGGVQATSTCSSGRCLDQAGGRVEKRAWGSSLWREWVPSSSRGPGTSPPPLLAPLFPCDSRSLGRSPWRRSPRGWPVRHPCTCWPCSPCSPRPPLPGKHPLSPVGGVKTFPAPNKPILPRAGLLFLLTPQILTPSGQLGSARGRWGCGRDPARPRKLCDARLTLLPQGGCFPARGVFGCRCSGACGALRT